MIVSSTKTTIAPVQPVAIGQTVRDVIGFNVHMNDASSPASNTTSVITAMNYLGVYILRDWIRSTTIAKFNTLAASGLKFCAISGAGDTPETCITRYHNQEVAYPGSIRFIEGPSEVDTNPVTYGGQVNYAGARAYQAALFNAARADPVLIAKKIIAPSLENHAYYPTLGDIAATADYGNAHIYYSSGQPTWNYSTSDTACHWASKITDALICVPGKPVVVTEVGNNTYSAGAGVAQAVQAKQLLISVLVYCLQNGLVFYGGYELVDEPYLGATNPESLFGIFNSDWTPKPAATALKNLLAVIGDCGLATIPFTYNVTGLATGVQGYKTIMFQRGDGALIVAVWVEPDIWNESTHAVITPSTQNGTLTLSSTKTCSKYDPYTDTTTGLGSNTIFTFSIVDSPLLFTLT